MMFHRQEICPKISYVAEWSDMEVHSILIQMVFFRFLVFFNAEMEMMYVYNVFVMVCEEKMILFFRKQAKLKFDFI